MTGSRYIALGSFAPIGAAFASPPGFDAPESYARSLPAASIESAAKGDLSGDGMDDRIGAVAPATGFRGDGEQWCVIGATYRASKSSDATVSRWHSKDVNDRGRDTYRARRCQ